MSEIQGGCENRVRIVVTDDSPVVRELLVQLLRTEPGFDVVGQAENGVEAVRLAATLRPAVITMDLQMPKMDGLEAIRQIMGSTPTPVVVVSAGVTGSTAMAAALSAGALAVVEKPQGLIGADYEAMRGELVTAVRLAAGVTLTSGGAQPPRAALPQAHLIAIAASTGGPGILRQLLKPLPKDMAVPIVIVQHITSGFARGFAHWLNGETALEVRLAQDRDQVAPGVALVAPEGMHMTLQNGGIVRLSALPPVNGVRPSATLLFDSVARVYKSKAVGIVLTGMGNDGAEGLEGLWQAGGYTVAQDEASCVVFGMPKMAIERGVIHQVLTPLEIAALLLRLDEKRKSR